MCITIVRRFAHVDRAICAALLSVAALLAGCAGDRGGQYSSEQAVSQQVATSDSIKRAKIHTELGGLYLQDNRFAVAQDEARIALSADSNYAPAHNLLGLVHMYLQENQLAEESFERALRLAPGDPEINNNFGWFLCRTGREQRSMQYFQASLRNPLYTTPAKPLTNAGICSMRMKDDKAAEDYLLRALRLESNNSQAIHYLADITYRQGRLGAARMHITELHRLAEPNAESLWLAVRIERKLGDREAEARYASQLRRKFSGTPQYQRLIQGQYE